MLLVSITYFKSSAQIKFQLCFELNLAKEKTYYPCAETIFTFEANNIANLKFKTHKKPRTKIKQKNKMARYWHGFAISVNLGIP